METLSKLFRKKERRAIVHEVMEAVTASMNASMVLNGRKQNIISALLIGKNFVVSVDAVDDGGYSYHLFKDYDIIVSVDNIGVNGAAEILTCAIITFIGTDV
jgi:hypothetical protein